MMNQHREVFQEGLSLHKVGSLEWYKLAELLNYITQCTYEDGHIDTLTTGLVPDKNERT